MGRRFSPEFKREVRISRDGEAVGDEIGRVLATLRLDLGDPKL